MVAIYGRFVGVMWSIDRGMIQISLRLCFFRELCVFCGQVYN
jgi:hypothetical protein